MTLYIWRHTGLAGVSLHVLSLGTHTSKLNYKYFSIVQINASTVIQRELRLYLS